METIQTGTIILMVIFIVAETIARFKKSFDETEVKDRLSSIVLGISSLLVSLTMKGILIDVFTRNSNWTLLSISYSWKSMLLLFIINDFISYWYHRLAHHSRFFWATHIVHHSSQKYNLTVGIRESLVEGVYRFFYWIPLCLIGFSPLTVFMVDGLMVAYSGFLHTEFVGRLGFIERIFMTPSNHRVHHASNPEYIDKNFGTVLVVWDKIFGTYIQESKKPTYGLTDGFLSYNPIKINIEEWKRMAGYIKVARSMKDKLKIVFGSPAYVPESAD